MTITFKNKTFGAELAGFTTLNKAPIIRLWTGHHAHTATNLHAARIWLSDHGLRKSKAKILLDAIMVGKEITDEQSE